MSNALERYVPVGIERLDRRAHAYLAGSLDIGHFRAHPEDLGIGLLGLEDLGLEPSPINLREVWVLHGKLDFQYPLLVALLRRAGGEVGQHQESDEQASVELRAPGSDRFVTSTVRWEDIRNADWVKGKPLWETTRSHMLLKTALRWGINLHAAEVSRMLVVAEDHADRLARRPPPRRPEPVEADSRPQLTAIVQSADPHVVDDLKHRYQALPDDARDFVQTEARRAGIPNLNAPSFTQAHVLAVEYLISIATAPAGSPNPVGHGREDQPAAGAEAPEAPTPSTTRNAEDGTPPSAPATLPYDQDPERPFDDP